MATQTDNTGEQQNPLRELTQRLRELGVSDEVLAIVAAHTIAAQAQTASELTRRFNREPVTLHGFADELARLTLRVQGLGVAVLGLTGEHRHDPYVEGIHQLVTDLEDNAHRLEATFTVLWEQLRTKP